MSRITKINFRGKTIASLGRTVDMTSFPAREKNVDILYKYLNEEREDLIRSLLSGFSAMAAHHPTKEEVEEWLHDIQVTVEYAVDTAEVIGVSRVLVNMMEEEDVDIKFY